MLNQKRLKSLLGYDPETGIFTRLVCLPGYAAGSIAGTVGVRGYICIKIDGKSYKAHRLAWLYVHGEWPKVHIDHIDGDAGNNAFANLRDATRCQNLANCRKYTNNTSGLKGVSWHKSSGKWCAYIQANGRRIHLGLFTDPAAAHQAFLDASKIYHGEFARAA